MMPQKIYILVKTVNHFQNPCIHGNFVSKVIYSYWDLASPKPHHQFDN